MIGKPSMTPETEAMLGPELVEFISQLDQGPDIIVSELDFDQTGWLGDIAEYQSLTALFNQQEIGSFFAKNKAASRVFMANNDELSKVNAVNISEYLRYQGVKEHQERDFDFVRISSGEQLLNHFFDRQGLHEMKEKFDSKDLMVFALFHEIGHNQDKQIGWNTAHKEVDSDLYAARLYQDAYEQGIVSDPSLPEKWLQYRAVILLAGGPNSISRDKYAFNGMIDSKVNGPESLAGFLEMQPTIYQKYLKAIFVSINSEDTMPEPDVYAQKDAFSFIAADLIAEGAISGSARRKFKNFDYKNADPRELQAVVDEVAIPEHLQDKYEQGLEHYVKIQFAHAHPEIFYVYVSQALMNGDFDYDKHLRQFAENFVLGAENLAPVKFDAEAGVYQAWLAEREVDAPTVPVLAQPTQGFQVRP